MSQSSLPATDLVAAGESVAPSWRPVVPRTLAAISLVAASGLSAVFVFLQPQWPDSNTALLETVAAQPGRTTAAIVAFTVSQLFLIGAVLAIGDVARSRAPRLIGAGMVVAIIGAFGHAVMGGLQLAMLGMLPESGREQYAAALDRTYDSAMMLFAVAGLLGTAAGLVLLAAGLWRSRTVATAIPACIAGFVVLEFVGGGFSAWASFAAVGLLAAGFLGVAAAAFRRS